MGVDEKTRAAALESCLEAMDRAFEDGDAPFAPGVRPMVQLIDQAATVNSSDAASWPEPKSRHDLLHPVHRRYYITPEFWEVYAQ